MTMYTSTQTAAPPPPPLSGIRPVILPPLVIPPRQDPVAHRRALVQEFVIACQQAADIVPAGVALKREFEPPEVGVRWRSPAEYTGYYLLIFPSGCQTCALYEEDARTAKRQRVAIWQLAELDTGAALLAACRQESAARAWAEFEAEAGCAVVL